MGSILGAPLSGNSQTSYGVPLKGLGVPFRLRQGRFTVDRIIGTIWLFRHIGVLFDGGFTT